MTNEKQNDYVKLIDSLTSAFKLREISWESYISSLEIIIKSIKKQSENL